jgi:hypothetical protein
VKRSKKRFLDSICGGVVDLPFSGIIGILAFRHSNLMIFQQPSGYDQIFWFIDKVCHMFLKYFYGNILKIFLTIR